MLCSNLVQIVCKESRIRNSSIRALSAFLQSLIWLLLMVALLVELQTIIISDIKATRIVFTFIDGNSALLEWMLDGCVAVLNDT